MPQWLTTARGMMTKEEKRQRNQLSYQNRARSARLYGKLLIPVALVTLSTSLWSDPVLGPQLETGVENMQPLLAQYAQETPLDGMFGPVPEVAQASADIAAQASGTEEASLDLEPALPASVTPVNRP